MQGSPPLPSPIKRIFYMSSEGTNLHHEVGMQFSQRKRTIVTEMPYGNLNDISFLGNKALFQLLCSHVTFVRINVVLYLVSFWQVFPAVNRTVLEQLLQVDAVVYGMGSLYTSICPSLVHISLSLCSLCKSFILEKTWVA